LLDEKEQDFEGIHLRSKTVAAVPRIAVADEAPQRSFLCRSADQVRQNQAAARRGELV